MNKQANKVLSFRQRLALQVGKAARSPAGDNQDSPGASFPYGFERYAKVAAACRGRKLVSGLAYDSFPGEFGA